jgi:hypothetical protein
MRCLWLIALLFLLGNSCYAQQESVTKFLNLLQEDTTTIVPDNQDDEFWHGPMILTTKKDAKDTLKAINKAFANIFKDQQKIAAAGIGGFEKSAVVLSGIRFPEPDSFLSKPLLLNNVKVIEEKNKIANGHIGVAACHGGSVKILYSTRPDERICNEVFIFFREHEFAHVKLKHASCTYSQDSKTKVEQEIEADAEATVSILKKTDGDLIIMYVCAALYAMNEKAHATHPSSKQRALTIRAVAEKF